MPTPSQPLTFFCNQCQWRRTWIARSDVLEPQNWPLRCSRCGSEQLTLRVATSGEVRKARWLEAFSGLFS